MTTYDLIAAAADNLWRMRLRSILTIAGVVIAIAAFVSMMSFGAGNQRYVNKQFEKFGVLSTMHVFPRDAKDSKDSGAVAVLNDSVITRLAGIPGVRLVYPFEAFEVQIKHGDSTVTVNAQAVSSEVSQIKALSQYVAGGRFASDSASQVVLARDVIAKLGVTNPDSMVGRPIEITARLIRLDSAMMRVVSDNDDSIKKRLRALELDSLFKGDYAERAIRREVKEAIRRFLIGFTSAREVVTETLTVSGILADRRENPMRVEQVILPAVTAKRLNSGDFSLTPASLMTMFSNGTLPEMFSEESGKQYSKVTLDLDPHQPYQSVRDSVKALGFRSFSFAEQFEEIQNALIYFDMALGLIGLIALVTASLGITNTMIMSILERRREIGVLKALGADDSDIRRIFLFEAAAIGTLGAILGILLGWAISRVASAVAQAVMRHEGVQVIDLFALPLWLMAIALTFGIVVSLLAGYYPARRAARLDPVESLRNE